MSGIDPARYLLAAGDSDRIFHEQIVPRELSSAEPVAEPCVVFVAGQPGAGKTKTAEAVVRSFEGSDGAVVVNSDLYKPYHPACSALLETDDVTAAPYTSMDGRRWMALAQSWLIERRMNVVVETTMRDAGDFVEPARMFREQGYTVEAVVVAVPDALSRLGILDRYAEQVHAAGHGRLTETANHDASYAGVRSALQVVDEEHLVDLVTIYRRGNQLLYANEAVQTSSGREWAAPPMAVAALDGERARTLTYPEAHLVLDNIRGVRGQLSQAMPAAVAEVDALLDTSLPPAARAHHHAADAHPRLTSPLQRGQAATDAARLQQRPTRRVGPAR